jgi:hypothetical protein
MEEKVRWAKPEYVIGLPRLQKVDGFYYLYTEQKHIHESEVRNSIGPMFSMICDTYKKRHGKTNRFSILVIFFTVPNEPRMYDIQVGYSVLKRPAPEKEIQVRYVEPTLCASVLVRGNLDLVKKSCGLLVKFMYGNKFETMEGRRELYLYCEGMSSTNNTA